LTRSPLPAAACLSVVAHDVTILVTKPLAACTPPPGLSDRLSSPVALAAPFADATVDSPENQERCAVVFPD
jgi:hypothetical protein